METCIERGRENNEEMWIYRQKIKIKWQCFVFWESLWCRSQFYSISDWKILNFSLYLFKMAFLSLITLIVI